MSKADVTQTNRTNALKVGIVGCGNIARIQLKYINKYIEKEAIALCDKNYLRMEYLSKEFGIANTFTDTETMLQKFQPKAVHILTPPHTHKDIAVLFLKSGCHVFLEKPMCLSIKDAEEIIEIAKKRKILVCVDHMRLFDTEIIKVKKMLNSGKFGQIVNIAISEVDNFLERKEAGLSPRWMSDLPGEIFYDLFPHHLSLLDEFMPELKFRGVVYKKNENNDLTDVHCLFSSSYGTGSIHMSLYTYPLQNNIVFECTKGTITVDFRNFMIIIRKKSELPVAVERVFDNFSISRQLIWGTIGTIFRFLRGRLDTYAGMDNTIRAFYDSISQDKESPVPAERGLFVIKAIKEIFREIPEVENKGKTDELGKELQKADVLVTGGRGFIGQKLVKRLSAKGYNVRVLTHRDLNKKELNSNSDVEFVKGDISNLKDVENVYKGVEIVYHLAAATKGNWFHHLDTTVTGTQNIIDAAIKSGVKHLIYISTIGLLDATKYLQNSIINEDFPYEKNPGKRGYYSNAKLMAEKTVQQHMNKSDKMTITIIRPGLVYGPGKNPLLDVARRIMKNLVVVLGSGRRILPFVYVENLVDSLVLAGESKEKGTYNVIDRGDITEREFIRAYKEMTGEKFFVLYLPIPFFKVCFWVAEHLSSVIFGKSPSLLYKLKAVTRSVKHSTERIERRLSWSPKLSFEEGLRETLNSLWSDHSNNSK